MPTRLEPNTIRPSARKAGLDVVIGAERQLLQSAAVDADPPDVPPRIVLLAAGEDHLPPVPGDLRRGDVAVREARQRRDLAVRPRRAEPIQIVARPIFGAGVGHDVGLPPAVGLLHGAQGVGNVVVALDED